MSTESPTLERLAQRLDKLEAAIDAFGTLAERLPVIADAAATGATWAWQQAEAHGVDPISAAERGGKLALTLGKDENLALAERLLSHGDSLVPLLDALESVPAERRAALAKQAGAVVAAALASPELLRLLERATDPAALSTAERATTALVDVRKQPVAPLGLFGALRMMGDGDVQRAVGFSLALAKRFGQLLRG